MSKTTFTEDRAPRLALHLEAADSLVGVQCALESLAMTVLELSEEQQAEIRFFSAEESVRLANAEAKNAKRKAKDRQELVSVVQEFVRKHEWPDISTAKDWLTRADPTQKLGCAAGV